MHGKNGLKFDMVMYPDHLQNRLDFAYTLLFFPHCDLMNQVKFGVWGHFLQNTWEEWSEIWHADVSWPPSELIIFWQRLSDKLMIHTLVQIMACYVWHQPTILTDVSLLMLIGPLGKKLPVKSESKYINCYTKSLFENAICKISRPWWVHIHPISQRLLWRLPGVDGLNGSNKVSSWVIYMVPHLYILWPSVVVIYVVHSPKKGHR